MKSWADMVEEFNRSNGYPPLKKPSILELSNDEAFLRLHLMCEELGELSRAMNERELIKFADSITDLLYVVVGTAVATGLGPILEDLFEEVHRSNMTKTFPARLGQGHRGALKGPGFESPDLASIIDGYTDALKSIEESAGQSE